ncbi:MAG: pilus assembly protein N-terminal domain-containing protein [Deltaproteobacteria bacterium]|nr:pilus assembly protein N-terminal domain-containing protein [Deltaproteobacteria bacterium]MBI2182469.1 pilus assembly protein N-terminal domain-containing protein [Deltaproteobacteria bacterium]MBI2228478.1 pilus assembly protein N-terminal domain-containing protein [Deltaproteobacteria bacterium]MBI2364829.1 pilus assembly protein N-terminal domain-containing protein [Deltaproteobacteria bacterium]
MANSREMLRGALVSRVVMVSVFFILAQAAVAQGQPAPAISVTVNKSMVFRLAERAKRVSVSQPAVADVIVVAPSQLLINGKAVGTTSLIVFNEQGEVSNFDLIVTPDVAALRGQLRVVLPNEKIEVSTSGTFLVLRGEVSNEVVYDKVLEITESYLPPKPPAAVAPPSSTTNVSVGRGSQRQSIPTSGVGFAGGGQLAFNEESSLTDVDRWGDKRKTEGIIDLLVIKEVRQIELDVIVAEVALNKLREIGFDALLNTNNVTSNTFNGSQSGFGSNLFSGTGDAGKLLFGAATSGIFTYATRGFALTSLYRMMQNKDITEILAQPRLVMKNGRSGGFLAGGEFPVVTSTSERFEVEFRPFGVRLDFVPTLTWSDRIDLRVFPEVSEIDQSVAVNGVPGLKVRRTVNRVEMKDGESLVIAGLLDRRILKDLTKFPILGDIPILGALFRSTRFRNQESELVFVITPRIVRTMKPGEKPQLPSLEKYDDPDIRQVPVPESWEGRKPASRGATIP